MTRVCLGAISGTSMDAIDVAALATDGRDVVEFLGAGSGAYPQALRERLLAIAADPQGAWAEPLAEESAQLADAFAQAVRGLLDELGLTASEVALLGCHGQTVVHDPGRGRTRQLGDCQALARTLGIDVVGDFRQADVAAGGQGAPLAPLYHAALLGDRLRPAAVLNLGGVGNVTYVGEGLAAFDTGPANALMDDYMQRHCGKPLDEDGALAGAGSADQAMVAQFLLDPYFAATPPKSLDRFHFHGWLERLAGLPAADAMATLLEFTVASVTAAIGHLPAAPPRWLVTGGGRRNGQLLARLQASLAGEVASVESAGLRGDSMEAEAFAYLAMRAVAGLPLSLPTTTGVAQPTPGGRLYKAD